MIGSEGNGLGGKFLILFRKCVVMIYKAKNTGKYRKKVAMDLARATVLVF
jgi:hypothetical protein